MDSEETYRKGYLITSQCLAKAMGSLAYAVQAVKGGAPGTLLVDTLEKDIKEIKELMK